MMVGVYSGETKKMTPHCSPIRGDVRRVMTLRCFRFFRAKCFFECIDAFEEVFFLYSTLIRFLE